MQFYETRTSRSESHFIPTILSAAFGVWAICMPVAEMTTDKAKIFSSLYACIAVRFLCVTAVCFAHIIHRVLHVLHVEEKES